MKGVGFGLAVLAALMLTPCVAAAAKLDRHAVNAAELAAEPVEGINPAVIRAQVLLDRARFSPGVVDGHGGENFDKALAAFQAHHQLEATGKLDEPTYAKLKESSGQPVLVTYEITKGDVNGPFTKTIPDKMEKMAALRRLNFRNPRELLAEKFHMDQDLLSALNGGKRLDRAGTTIVVAAVEREKASARVSRIEIDKDARWLKAYAGGGALVAFYPASVGSEEKPAPTGAFEVKAIAMNPTYEYNPDYNFKGVKTKKRFTIAAGPNNPVGVVWIDLSADSYGIHGTPEPAKIGKTESHGCIRLTNWDARDLAAMVGKGVAVTLVE